MSREDLEVTLRSLELWNRGELDAWKEMYRQDVKVLPPEGWPEAEPADDIDAWFRQGLRLRDSWATQRIEIDEVREVGGRVLCLFRWITTGKDSQIELETPMAFVNTVVDGKIARQEFFGDREQALAAAGVSAGRTLESPAGKGD